MLGNTLTMTLDGAGGTAKVLPYIGDGGVPYSGEYQLDDGTSVYRIRVRHSKDSTKPGAQKFDRHTVTFSKFLKPNNSNALLVGSLNEVSFTIRNDPSFTFADVIDLSEAMAYFMVKEGGIAAKLLNWES